MNNSNFFIKEHIVKVIKQIKEFFKSTMFCSIVFSLLMLIPFLLVVFVDITFNAVMVIIVISYLIVSGAASTITIIEQIQLFDENKTIFKNLSDAYLIPLVNMFIYLSILASFAILRYFSANNYSLFIACCLITGLFVASWYLQVVIMSDFIDFQWNNKNATEEILEKLSK